MARYEETLPTPRILLALKNQAWTTTGAISELVDNSFGPGRGNANNVWITWDKKRRVLEVLDDGAGMDNVTRLFQLGNTVGRSVGDIGQYGSGGTWALLWLAQRASVWTLRNGMVAAGQVNWDEAVEKDRFPVIDSDWYPATAANTPTELLRLRGGTMIRLVFPPKRHVTESNIRRDLSRTYGPALRHGKKITWRSIGKNATEDIQLADAVTKLPRPKQLQVFIEVDGHVLSATGKAAVLPDQTISDSAIAVCFGPRAIRFTRECFASPDGVFNFAGIGVVGYLDLDDGWQPYLTTTKTAVDDDRLWAALMGELFSQLRPLLEKTQEDKEYMLLEDIGFDLERVLNKHFGTIVNVKRPGRGEDGDAKTPDRWPETGEGNGGPGDNPTDPKPQSEQDADESGAVKLEICKVGDELIDGLLCRVDIDGKRVECFVNDEHPYVREAMVARPPNRHALHHLIVSAIAAELYNQRPQLFAKIFTRSVVGHMDRLEPRLKLGFITRVLLDRVHAAPAGVFDAA
jgi:hypothetical protein